MGFTKYFQLRESERSPLTKDVVPAQRPVISYDFDGVLHQSMVYGTIHPINYWSADLDPRYDMHEQLRKDAAAADIIVVSARCVDTPVREFIRRYSLPVKRVYVTCDRSKLPTLTKQRVMRHYDDNEEMEFEIEQSGLGIEFILVRPSDE